MNANGPPGKSQQPPPVRSDIPPNQTLYVRNLNDKISKPDLRRALFTLFSSYGHILDIVALKTPKMRGQAHIVFRNVQASTQAIQALQGFEFLGKELKLEYGKGRSDIISKLDGSVRAPESTKTQALSASNGAANSQPFPAPSSLPQAAAPAGSLQVANAATQDGSKSPQGTKRPRDDQSDDEGESIEEDDDGEDMDVSDDD